MKSKFLSDFNKTSESNFVSDSHFGVNYVSGTNSFGSDANFSRILESLGGTSIRYPGGTVTEKYFLPGSATWEELFVNGGEEVRLADGAVLEGPSRVFEFATNHDMSVQFVLPTKGMVQTVNGRVVVDMDKIESVEKLVGDILDGKFGDVTIDQFEIGNEYYFYANLTAEEYGAVADAMVQAVDSAIQDYAERESVSANWQAPKIAIQAGAGWQAGDNTEIIDALSEDTLDLIDSVIIHYYPENLDEVDLKDRQFGQFEEWKQATRNPNLEFFVSEWNVYGDEDADTGMKQASSIVSAFEELIRNDVDTAAIWGTEFRWLKAGLTTNYGGDDLSETETRLSVSGEMFASLRESLIDLTVFELDPSDLVTAATLGRSGPAKSNEDYVINSFANEDRAVLYISSRSSDAMTLQLDLSGYFGKTTHVWGETLTSVDDPETGWRDESDPNEVGGLPDFDILNARDLGSMSEIVLQPFQVLRVSVQLSDDGVVMSDHDPISSGDISYDDVLIGSAYGDRITAHIGNDSLIGGNGNDAMRAGIGDDDVWGGDGHDAIHGDAGRDVLRGGNGNDLVIGGSGHDVLYGGNGQDALFGGSGEDAIFGGEGNDVLVSGTGDALLFGEGGADYFVVSPDGFTHIDDFELADGDRITFLGQFETREDLLNSIRSTGAEGDPRADLIITNELGNKTIITVANNDIDGFLDSVVDFQPEGEKAIGLADILNEMSSTEIVAYLDELDTDAFADTLLRADPIILLSNLSPRAAATVLNTLEQDDIDEAFGQKALAVALSGLNDREIVKFFDFTNSETASNVADMVGEATTKSILDGMSFEDRQRLELKLLGEHQDVDHDTADTRNDGDIGIPRIPVQDDRNGNISEDDEDDDGREDVQADCFVATVVYADGEHTDVWLLRWYRDVILRKSLLGRMLIVIYWTVGPWLAERVSGNLRMTKAFRWMISRIVSYISYCHDRKPGRQPDQPTLTSSRTIRIFKVECR